MRKMNVKKMILLAGCLLWTLCSYSQGQRLGAPPEGGAGSGSSPSGQGLGGVYSPNLYTGTAGINIPIYQYSVENSNFGVSFSYDTKGVTVNELASDAGLHWTINANATIQRVQKDLPDEISLIDGDTLVFLSTGSALNQPFPGYIPPPDDTVSLNPYWAFKGRYATFFESAASAADENIYRDKEADDFVVTLGSGTFTFNLCKNGVIFTHPKRSVSVEVLWDDQPLGAIGDQQVIGSYIAPNLLSFRIRDEQGNTYTFTRSEYNGTTIYDSYGRNFTLTQYHNTSKWVVTKVKLATGAEINYTYQPISYFMGALPANKTYSAIEGAYTSDCVDTSYYQEYMHSLKLQSIQYPNGVTLSFNYDAQKRPDYAYGALREVKVASGTNCLNYVLQQSFFNSDPATPEKTYAQGLAIPVATHYHRKLRLKLNGIKLASCDNSIQEPYYSFTYDETILPERLSAQQDYFGYYNGQVSNPYPSCNFAIATPFHHKFLAPAGWWYGMDKSPVFASMKAAIIKSVTNAYGGTAEFYYGAHINIDKSLLNVPSDDYYFGDDNVDNDGLRLDSIVEWEPYNLNNKKVTAFEYSGGQRFFNGGYFHYDSRLNGSDSTATDRLSIVMTSNFLTPHQMVSGSNHGYTNVNVITRTGSGDLLSRKEIKFSNFKDGNEPLKYVKTGSQKDFFEYPYTDKQYLMDWAMGVPLEIKEYDQNNRIVQQTINQYNFTLDTTSAIGKVDNQRVALVPVSGWSIPIRRVMGNKSVRDSYRPFTGAALLQSTIVRKYVSDVAFLADTVRYHYDARNNMDIIYTRNSKGQEIQTRQAYNYTLNSPLGSTLLAMTQAGLEKMVGTERWLMDNGGTTSNKLLDAFFNTFNYQDGKLSPKFLYNLQAAAPLTYAQYTGYTGGSSIPVPFEAQLSAAFAGSDINNFVKTSQVILADGKCNPLETKLLGQELYKAMIWDTAGGQKLAEASSCRFSDIAYTSFESKHANGNFSFSLALGATVPGGMTGKTAYDLWNTATNSPNTLQGTQPLATGKTYMLSFWVKGNNAVAYIGNTPLPMPASPVATVGNWKQYQLTFVPAPGESVRITSTAPGAYLDEVRLHPVSATMQSQTYEPLFGVSSATDASGRIIYYEYDALGRQNVVRDQEGNVLSKTQYVVNGVQ
jgi:YD repeat-containing protein